MSVAIEISNRNTQALSRFRKTSLFGGLGEVTMAVVVIDEWENRLKLIGMAEGTVPLFSLSTPDVSKIPLQIAQHY